MKPLLKIQSIPTTVEFKTKPAMLRINNDPAKLDVTRKKGGMQIRTEPAKVTMDSTEMRASLGLKSGPRLVRDNADAGRVAAADAARENVENGNRVVESRGRGEPLADIAMSRIMNTTDTILDFLPSSPPQIQGQSGSVNISNTPDRLDFNWAVSPRPQLEFVSGKIEFSIKQYAQVIIEYLGTPIYAPPSSDPNYEDPGE